MQNPDSNWSYRGARITSDGLSKELSGGDDHRAQDKQTGRHFTEDCKWPAGRDIFGPTKFHLQPKQTYFMGR